ncbi:glutamyl-tRNA reductase [Natrinema pallidum]|uniref:Glutamyl-tRNA reductase n=2 Tax=Natrinema pallidum TaxID=69527 RepID=L9YQY4_9EURY|nr:glutamyl-tRNA reductase [Natrinema pallidum]ELY76509.1 glutamyl-tRNA reductase [Natrinema pallidum DSM 3751]QCW03137.1 glutamyl-tRNA reductase [Natrinema pallidum]
MSTGVVTAARVTHESGTVDQLATASPDSQETAVTELLTVPDIEEAYVLSTCNRVEAYVVGADHAVGRAALEEFFAATDDEAVVITGHDESLRHLLRVATGLESVILGEDQIIGQVRTAYEDARAAGGIGSMLEAAVTKAIHVGERARTETAINEGVVSLGSAATRRAAAELPLDGATALVVGAGEMGRLAARNLAASGIDELVVANRTVAHADHLVGDLEVEVDTRVVPLEALETVVTSAEVVVTATGSDEPVLGPRHLDAESDRDAGEGETEQVIVDLGQPRDVAPAAGTLPAVQVFDLDDLESVTAETREQRADAAREVEAMIDREYDLLTEQYKRARADEAIAAMYESAERIKDREVETALSHLEGEVTEGQREVVESMADALVNQLLAPPTKSLREAAAEDDWSTIHTALQLFNPEFDGDDGPLAPPSVVTANADPGLGATDDD